MMNKLCCLPLSEPPEMNLKVNCVSSCCASETKTKDDDWDNTSQHADEVARTSKCCCGKRRKTSKSHAKQEQKEDNLKHE